MEITSNHNLTTIRFFPSDFKTEVIEKLHAEHLFDDNFEAFGVCEYCTTTPTRWAINYHPKQEAKHELGHLVEFFVGTEDEVKERIASFANNSEYQNATGTSSENGCWTYMSVVELTGRP